MLLDFCTPQFFLTLLYDQFFILFVKVTPVNVSDMCLKNYLEWFSFINSQEDYSVKWFKILFSSLKTVEYFSYWKGYLFLFINNRLFLNVCVVPDFLSNALIRLIYITLFNSSKNLSESSVVIPIFQTWLLSFRG